jgi:hypothetical protein
VKIHVLTSINVYEFLFDDLEYVDSVLSEIQNSNLEYTGDKDQGKVGYINKDLNIPYYNEKLFSWFEEKIHEVGQIHFPNLNFEICDSWIVRALLGNKSESHAHINSFISGLFYLTEHKNSSTVFSYDDIFAQPYENLKNVNDTAFRIPKTFTSSPKKGKLLLWPSYLTHRVATHTEKNIRYTLAFNSYPTGSISHRSSASLEFKVKSVKEKFEEYTKNKVTNIEFYK